MLAELQPLLNELGIISLRQQLRQPDDRFNIFRILRSEADEVNLHSRFLYELLNPKGSHGMGDMFLRLFATVADFSDLDYTCVQVLREHANIDILIQDNKHAIVIENKIYAGDQHEQLKRYHTFASGSYRTPTLLYLTLYGHEPSEWSKGDMSEKVHLISYREHIDAWLIECIKEAVTKPTLRETLIQYQTLVRQLTGNTMSEEEKQEVLRLMSQSDNAEKAAIIVRNWGHVRWQAESEFWNDLKIALNHYKIPLQGLFSDYLIHKAVHYTRNHLYYGISLKFGELFGNDIYARLERNQGPVYIGIPNEGHEPEIYNLIKKEITGLGFSSFHKWSTWNWKHIEPQINFENFETGNTFLLINPNKRKDIIKEIVIRIEDDINSIIRALLILFPNDFVPAQSN